MRRFCIFLLAALAGIPALAQKIDAGRFASLSPVIDSILAERTGVSDNVRIKKAKIENGRLFLYLTDGISNFPLRPGDAAFLKDEIQKALPEEYSDCKIGDLRTGKESIGTLAVSHPGNNGSAPKGNRTEDRKGPVLVNRGIEASRGLSGRHIALWQSHGLYYNNADSCWMWQRPVMFQIVEDLFTQSFVVPFLTPMLENAGANVLLPRERDWRKAEIIIDNDSCETQSGRIHGGIRKKGTWNKATSGFCDMQPYYRDGENPFLMGSFLWNNSVRSKARESKVSWAADVPEKGEYAVYVTYPMLPDACPAVRYTVHAAGGNRDIIVNQRMGGGIWIYLGTYEFEAGNGSLVSVSNISKEKGVVSADAVRIGGGMGCILRPSPCSADSCATSGTYATSGMPRFTEGARYNMQWSGVPEKVWSQNNGENDYRDDLMCRGMWVQYLAGGTKYIPRGKGLGIPIDLSLAFHTDAGTFPNDSIVGTLAIYTLKCNNSPLFADRESRSTCRELTDFIQTQIVEDIRAGWDSRWTRRQIWNRSYSESRTTGVPAMLLELLSHQNFEDMKYGLDPEFRFTASRAVYKAILKYLSMRYGCAYTVQPLPVTDFSAQLLDKGRKGLEAGLRWRERVDTLEPTATADAFLIYTRINGKGWDNGRRVTPRKEDGLYSVSLPVKAGSIYSFKVVAVNDGGLSFPSEILSVGAPENGKGHLLIVNDFHRVSGPVWFDSSTYAGFDNLSDSGVPYIRDWCFTGAQTEFDRAKPFINDVDRGFGASEGHYADKVAGGNSFDYPYVHGEAAFMAGYSFSSCSSTAFEADPSLAGKAFAVDLICGKECEVLTAWRTPRRGGIFTDGLMSALRHCADSGLGIMISGCYIGHDIFGSVYPGTDIRTDSLRIRARRFAGEVLGYNLKRAYGSRTGEVISISDSSILSFPTSPCEGSYCVESPDALEPSATARPSSETYLRYADTGLPAALRTDFGSHKVAAFGFPLEITRSSDIREAIIGDTIDWLHQ